MYNLRKPRQKKPDVFQINLWYYLVLDRFYKHCISIKWWEVSSQIKTFYYTCEKKCLYNFNTCHLIFFLWSPQFSPNQHVFKMITCSLILIICHVYMHISIRKKKPTFLQFFIDLFLTTTKIILSTKSQQYCTNGIKVDAGLYNISLMCSCFIILNTSIVLVIPTLLLDIVYEQYVHAYW